jgi:hypothetical protein
VIVVIAVYASSYYSTWSVVLCAPFALCIGEMSSMSMGAPSMGILYGDSFSVV